MISSGSAFGKEDKPHEARKKGAAAGIKTLSTTKISGGTRNEKNP
jgi:hypothetical protein